MVKDIDIHVDRHQFADTTMSIRGNYEDRNCLYEFEDRKRFTAKISRWDAARTAIYDSSSGRIFGRTRSSWGIVGLFYLVFFSALAVMCAICYRGFMTTINLKRPKWILEESLIGTSPGLGFRPISENTDAGSLVWYNATNAIEVAAWAKRIDKFLDVYINSSLLPTKGRNQQYCSNTQLRLSGKVCSVDVTNWDNCSPGGSYGYKHSAPCFFIKLNKIYGWKPIYYGNTTSLPQDMPETLADHIKSTNDSTLNTVWVTCDGQNPADREVIGDIQYYPKIGGFPGYYFPYTNIAGYLSPLVAVQFARPKRNVIINVECRAWAQNIRYNDKRQGREGSVHFSFMIDD